MSLRTPNGEHQDPDEAASLHCGVLFPTLSALAQQDGFYSSHNMSTGAGTEQLKGVVPFFVHQALNV